VTIHLRAVSTRNLPPAEHGFPYSVPIIRSLETLEFPASVTLFVGENGSGKSTLLEALACAVDSIVVGSADLRRDPTLAGIRKLSQYFRLTWEKKRVRKGFFLRAEDFFGFAKRMAQLRAELENDLAQVDRDYQDRSKLAADLARQPYAREIQDLQQRYGEGLDSASHGESFLNLFRSRFVPGGLYLLDEPEVPLSPLRQLALLAMLKDMVAQDAQFIIATHSPILLAFPGATIYSFDNPPIKTAAYEELEHVSLTRDFLNDPQAFLHHL
jgi:predicted ATPase